MIVRYNISKNDRGNIFCINYPNTSAYIYNNVVYISPHLSPTIIDERRRADKTYYFYNNIIYNMSPTAKYNWFNANREFSHNIFYGEHPEGEPDDPNKITKDPLFVNPENSTVDFNSIDGYRLQAGSPAINSGLLIPDNGDRDIWGNLVSAVSSPNRGAYNEDPISSKSVLRNTHVSAGNYTDKNDVDHSEKLDVIASVNEEEITVREFQQEMNHYRANVFSTIHKQYSVDEISDFWEHSFDGKTPLEILKEKMTNQELSYTEKDLKQYFEEVKEQRYGPDANNFENHREDVRPSYLDSLYNNFIETQLTNKTIQINEKLYK